MQFKLYTRSHSDIKPEVDITKIAKFSFGFKTSCSKNEPRRKTRISLHHQKTAFDGQSENFQNVRRKEMGRRSKKSKHFIAIDEQKLSKS